MKPIKIIILAIIMISNMILFTGCWNYREIDKVAIVAGVAVDKGEDHKFKVTIEIVQILEGRDAKPKSQIITIEGDTMFDAVRNAISVTGKRLYWAHAKILILSQEIAKEGVVKIVDWFSRDSETREDVNILVSGGETAGEILQEQTITESIMSYELYQMIENENSLGKAPHVEIWKFINDLESKETVAITPRVVLEESAGKKLPKISGTAVFRRDEFMGFLDEDDTKNMLFVQNKIKSGVIPIKHIDTDKEVSISLEIFKNKTKINPRINNGNVEINVNTDTTVSIDEIDENGGTEDFINNKGRDKLEKATENKLENEIEKTVKKVQEQFGVDIFGIGSKIRQDYPSLWKQLSGKWRSSFKNVKVNVNSKIRIKNSGMMSEIIQIGE